MRILTLTLAFFGVVNAFQVGLTRRDAIHSGAAVVAGLVTAAPQLSNAFSQQLDENAPLEPAQQATAGKIDLNNAFIVSSKLVDAGRPIPIHSHHHLHGA